jgi:hypothetical protein
MTKSTALLLSLLVLLAALTGCSSGGGDDGAGAEAGGAEAAMEADEGGGGGGADQAAQSSGGGAGAVAAAVPSVAPKVVKTASLRLSVERDGFRAASDEARSIAVGLGGFVVESRASQAGRGRLVEGSLVVRVPARSYEEAVRELGRVGRLEAIRDEAREVSAEFVDLDARRRHLEAIERQLLGLLDRANTVAAALSVQSQLNETQLQLEQVRGRLRFLDDQTTYATISLTIRERGVATTSGDDGWGIVEAWRDGARAFVTVAGKMFVVAAGAAPLVALLALGWLAARFLRRRIPLRWGASRP